MVSSEFGSTGRPQQILRGVARDIGAGGIGMTVDQPLSPGTVVRCEVPVQDAPIRIPILLKVCWLAEDAVRGQYQFGFSFLV